MASKARRADNKVMKGDTMTIYTDGACRGNPGYGAFAYVFCDPSGEIIAKKAKYLGRTTNNQAEYAAIINALRDAVRYTRWQVELYSDSKLAINQITKQWRIKVPELHALYQDVKREEANFERVAYFYTKRGNSMIGVVDKLCNKCLDAELGKK